MLFEYVLDIPGVQVGRKIYVRGDMTDHAFLYLGLSKKNMFLQWEIKDGQVVTQEPRRVDYSLDYTMGVQAKIVPIEVGANSNLFCGPVRRRRWQSCHYVYGWNNQPAHLSIRAPYSGNLSPMVRWWPCFLIMPKWMEHTICL